MANKKYVLYFRGKEVVQKNLPASFFYYKFIEVNITVQQAMDFAPDYS